MRDANLATESQREERWTLRVLSLAANPLTKEGARAVLETFERETTLRTVLGIEDGATELVRFWSHWSILRPFVVDLTTG